jgi:hypothetical protein
MVAFDASVPSPVWSTLTLVGARRHLCNGSLNGLQGSTAGNDGSAESGSARLRHAPSLLEPGWNSIGTPRNDQAEIRSR